MAAGTTPIFLATPKNWFGTTGTSANTALDGTGTVATIATAGSNGSKITRIRLTALGSNAATVVRFFINNGSSNGSATNNALMYEYALASNSLSQTAASIAADIPIDLALAAGYKLNVTIGTSVAAGVMVSAEGGDY